MSNPREALRNKALTNMADKIAAKIAAEDAPAMTVVTDERLLNAIEHALEAAYVRGLEWGEENPLDREYRFKAARDYADKSLNDPGSELCKALRPQAGTGEWVGPLDASRAIVDAWCERYSNGMPPVTARDKLTTDILSAASPSPKPRDVEAGGVEPAYWHNGCGQVMTPAQRAEQDEVCASRFDEPLYPADALEAMKAECVDKATAWDEIAKKNSKIAALRAQVASLREDKARLDWLETRTVNVRVPLVHGSCDLFWASPDDSFEGETGPSDIRAKIDRARADTGVSHE